MALPAVRAGDLRHTVTIQSTTFTNNADGSFTESTANAGTRRARIEPLRGREFLEARQLASEGTHRITMRYFSGLTRKHKIVFGSRTFEIVEPPRNPDERNWLHECICKEAS